MASKVNSSPGVYMTEKDLTFSVETVGVTTLGLVGETKKGPAFQPFFVKSYDDFKTFFGGTSPEKFKNTQIPKYELPYIAKSYLTQSNQLYVTRVLGLSGYDAGPAWSIKTIGTCDATTLAYTEMPLTSLSPFVAEAVGNTLYFVDPVSGVTATTAVDRMINIISDQYQNIDQIDSSAALTAALSAFFSVPNGSFTNQDAAYWGSIPQSILDALPVSGSTVDLYILPTEFESSQEEEHWLTNYFIYNQLGSIYNGKAFVVYGMPKVGQPSQYDITIKLLDYTCEANAAYHNKTVATLRSNAMYVADEVVFGTTAPDAITITGEVGSNPYAAFAINVTNDLDVDYIYNVSLDPNEKNFIKNVLGKTNTERATEIWVDESFEKTLAYGFDNGLIKGLNSEVTFKNNFNLYETGYKTPETPYFVSELRGGVAVQLFKFVAISDGADANTEVKISIANVDLAKKTFDVYVRAFADDDKKPAILEKYTNCSMDPNADTFIGKLVGTIDGTYDLNSAYVMVEVLDNAPIDAVPAGFEGYVFKGSNETPKIPFKTKYYAPGDVKYQPTLGSPVTSSGDKVRKVYLGFTESDFGWDNDLLKYKGTNDWATPTNGFHMDVNADPTKFSVGVSGFTNPVAIEADLNHPYHDIKTRKFTALFAGGFDGWDIYRNSRTNTDNYKIGRSGFIAGGFEQFYSEEFEEMFGTSDYYAYLLGIKTFSNPETVAINILATPGIDVINNTDLVRDTIDLVEENRQDSIYVATLPDVTLIDNDQPSNVENYYYPTEIVSLLEDTQIDSNYTSVYYPWIQILDTENNANLFIPPTSEVIRNLALTDNVAHPWYATAGYSRGLVNAKRTRIKLDQNQRDILYTGRINPLMTYPDINVTIWGNRNLQEHDSALNRINVRRLLLQAKKLIQAVSKRLLFDPNDERVRSEFLSLVNPILDNIRKERGLYDFRVKVSDDPADLDNNTLKGKIFLKPTRTLEFIELEFNITPTSVSFDAIS